jgi:hypothetical protein
MPHISTYHVWRIICIKNQVPRREKGGAQGARTTPKPVLPSTVKFKIILKNEEEISVRGATTNNNNNKMLEINNMADNTS